MRSPNSPYAHPEFTRTVNMVPFDQEFDEEARRQAQRSAVFLHFERKERYKPAKGVLVGLAICLVGWVIAVVWCSL